MQAAHPAGEKLANGQVEDVCRVAKACRKAAVLVLSGDPSVIDKAGMGTRGRILQRGR
jgi:hypothetical protein